MSDSDSVQADSASRNERPAERSVMPTAGDQLAKIKDFIDDKVSDALYESMKAAFERRYDDAHDAAVSHSAFDLILEFVEELIEANDASPQEGTSPTS